MFGHDCSRGRAVQERELARADFLRDDGVDPCLGGHSERDLDATKLTQRAPFRCIPVMMR